MDFYQETAQTIYEQIFSDKLFQTLLNFHKADSHARGVCNIEREYEKASQLLPSILARDNFDALQKAEQISLHCAKWLMQYAFTKGTCEGTIRYSMPNVSLTECCGNTFRRVMSSAEMEKYPEYSRNQRDAGRLFCQARKSLNFKTADLVTSIELAWQERYRGILCNSYYMGYRYALYAFSKTERLHCPPMEMADILKQQF